MLVHPPLHKRSWPRAMSPQPLCSVLPPVLDIEEAAPNPDRSPGWRRSIGGAASSCGGLSWTVASALAGPRGICKKGEGGV